jgi:hypothetical protein
MGITVKVCPFHDFLRMIFRIDQVFAKSSTPIGGGITNAPNFSWKKNWSKLKKHLTGTPTTPVISAMLNWLFLWSKVAGGRLPQFLDATDRVALLASADFSSEDKRHWSTRYYLVFINLPFLEKVSGQL